MDWTGKSLYKGQGVVGAGYDGCPGSIAFWLTCCEKTSGISFVVLTLRDSQERLVSHNIYWMEPRHDFTKLRQMPSTRVQVKVLKEERKGGDRTWTLEFTNVSKQLAFFLNPQLIKGGGEVLKGGEEVLPSFWSDNYFSLTAGETRIIRLTCPVAALSGGRPSLRLEGWNLAPQRDGDWSGNYFPINSLINRLLATWLTLQPVLHSSNFLKLS